MISRSLASAVAYAPLPHVDLRSADVLKLTGITRRQLQWWDESGLVKPERVGNFRVYTRQQCLQMMLIVELRRKGLGIEFIRGLNRTLRDAPEVLEVQTFLAVVKEAKHGYRAKFIVGRERAAGEALMSQTREFILIDYTLLHFRLSEYEKSKRRTAALSYSRRIQ